MFYTISKPFWHVLDYSFQWKHWKYFVHILKNWYLRNLNDLSEIIEKVKKSDSQLLFQGLQYLKKNQRQKEYFKSWHQEEPSALIPRGFQDGEEDLPILTVSFIQRDRLESSEVFGDSLQRPWIWHQKHP